MVLRDVIGVKARALVGFHDLQALAVEPLVRTVAEVEVIEDAEFHGGPCLFPLLFEEGCRRRRRGGHAANIEPPRRFAPPLLVQGGEISFVTAPFSVAAASLPPPRSRAST